MTALISNENLKNITTTAILLILAALSYFILRPILLSIVMGIILSIVLSKPYDWLLKHTKSRNFSLILICVFLISIIVIPFWFLTPIFVKQSFNVYQEAQKVDFGDVFLKIFPNFSFASEFGSVFGSFLKNTLSSLAGDISQWILNFPKIFLHLIIVFSTFFFILKDREEILKYLEGMFPFSKDVEKKLIQSSKDITMSVIYGQIVIGFVQGLIAALGFLIFGVPNMIFLTLLAVVAGILPIIGPMIVWIPVIIFLLISGNSHAAIGVSIFGVIAAIVDHLIRPFFVSKSTKMHPLLTLIGMIGGFFFFGVLGFILGPLILAYSIIILEIYRGKESGGVFIKKE